MDTRKDFKKFIKDLDLPQTGKQIQAQKYEMNVPEKA